MGVVICNNCKKFWWGNNRNCRECHSSTLTPTHESNRERIAWVLTDPDNHQYGRQVGDTMFEFKETNSEGEIVEITILLSHYTDEQKEKHISAYYDSLQEVKDTYKDQANWIIAECIFEQESGLY